MSQTIRKFSKLTSKKLIRALDKQIEITYSKYKYDDDINSFLVINELDIEDCEDTLKVILRKKVKNFDVEIHFDARAPITQENIEILEQEFKQEIYDNSEFDIFITNSKNSSGLYIDCSTYNSQIFIKSFKYSHVMKIFENDEASGFLYDGPDFDDKSSELPDCFLEYLKTFGIDPTLASFIESYSLDKEHRLYMAWLSKIRDFLQKK